MEAESNVRLARYTSLHVGGGARYFIRAKSVEDAISALEFAQAQQLPWFILGNGSNTLFPDDGFPGVVIHMEERAITVNAPRLTAASGVFMRTLVQAALRHNLRGLEELAGIPGTVGGSVRGNAGTWSTEMKDVLEGVDIVRPEARPEGHTWVRRHLKTEECAFSYRHSVFKERTDWVIVGATFILKHGQAAAGQELVNKDMRQRRQRQPYNAPSAGSVFKNPDKEHGVFAGALIEKAGLKGLRVGGAQISEKHSNFILNHGQAKSVDIMALITKIQTTVQKKNDIMLELEIVIVKPA